MGLAKAADQFRASDVTLWGVVALSCWGFAVLAANVSSLVPSSVLAGLHASRLDGGTVNQLRSQVSGLEQETERMRRENDLLLQRFTVAEMASGDVTRRVGALEVSVPQLLERVATAPRIDPSMTGSVTGGPVLSFDAEGGSVSVQQRPLIPMDDSRPDVAAVAAARSGPVADPQAFGLALGFPVDLGDAEAEWQSLTARVGTLLLGLGPLVAPADASAGQQIIAGPLASRGEAEQLCDRMDRVGIPCVPVAFTGEALPPPR